MSDDRPSDRFNSAGQLNKPLAQQRHEIEVRDWARRADDRADQVYKRCYHKWLNKEIERVWKERNKPDLKPTGPGHDKSKTRGSIEAEAGRRVQHRQQRRKDRIVDWRERQISQPRQSKEAETRGQAWREYREEKREQKQGEKRGKRIKLRP